MVVKICGLKTLEEVLTAADAGADMIGFNFYPSSPRYIDPEQCQRIMDEVKRRGMTTVFVGVFVNAEVDFIQKIMRECGLDLAQLSGDEPPDYLQKLGEKAYKALRLKDLDDIKEKMSRYPKRNDPPAWLFDAYTPGKYGGTGSLCNWELARNLAAEQPILLAGGLTPQNVAEAVEQVQPWGVDVASGVESQPGCKDPIKVRLFIRAVKERGKN